MLPCYLRGAGFETRIMHGIYAYTREVERLVEKSTFVKEAIQKSTEFTILFI
jgi:hypothetical protein